MALIYSDSVKSLTLGQGILSLLPSNYSAISIYSGVQPTASVIETTWPSYNTTNNKFLVHFQSAIWYQPSANVLSIQTYPAASTALHSGTAEWAIIWSSNTDSYTLGQDTLTNTDFIVVPCSSVSGNGIITFSDTTITEGTTKAIAGGAFKAVI